VSLSALEHRRLQLALRARAIGELLAAWRLFEGDIESWRRFLVVALPVVMARRRDSAGLALAHVRERAAEEGIALEGLRLPEPPPAEALERSLGATGLAGTWRALSVGASLEAARQVGFARLAMAAGRHVMDGGREAVLGAASASERRIRWRRVAAPSACAFCAMLASRGPVYASGTVDFPAHDGCACTAEPAFEGDLTRQEVELRAQWREATAGLSGEEALRAFRRARSGEGV